MNKLTFTGHETFHCRHFWLKKGYDYLSTGQSFKNPDAITALGALGLGMAYKATKDDKKVYSNKNRYQQPRKVDIDKVRKPNLFD